jgi:hypothetical protein
MSKSNTVSLACSTFIYSAPSWVQFS